MRLSSISEHRLHKPIASGMPGKARQRRETLDLPSPLLAYSLAVMLAVVAQIARIPLHPQTAFPLITYVPVILLSVWYCGFRPGLVTTVLCTLEYLYFATGPVHSVAMFDWQNWVGVLVLPLAGLISGIRFERFRKADRSRKQARSQADLLRGNLAAIVDSSDDAIIGKNLSGIITSWNRSAEKMFGYSADEAIGQHITFFMDPRTANEELAIQAKIQNGASVDHYETRRRRKDGMEVFVSVSVSPIRDASGKTIGMSKIARDITDEKRKEEIRARQARELSTQTEFLRGIVEHSPAAIAVLGGPEFTFEMVNPAYEAFQPGVSMAGKTVAEVWPDAAPLVLPLLGGVRETRTPYHAAAMPIPRRDGPDAPVEERFFTFSYVPFLGLEGSEESKILVVALEVTDQKRIEMSLRESEERLRTQMERMPIGCIVFDRHNCFSQMNPAAESILGYTRAELCGQHANVIVPENARPQVDGILRRLAEGDMTAHSENENVTKNGLVIICQWTNTPLRNGAGDFIGFLSMVQDISERKRAEEALRRAAEFDEVALKSIGEGLYTIDTDGLVTSTNPAAEELVGWTASELRGKNLHQMIHHHHADGRLFPSSECAAFQVLTHGRSLKNHEDIFIHKDGGFFDVTCSIAPLRDAAGQVVGSVLVFDDISERKQAEKALRASEDQFRTLANAIPQLSWMANPDGWIFWYNLRWYEYTGTTPRDMEGWGWRSVHDHFMLPKVLERWRASIAAGQPFEMIFPLRGADGVFRPFLTRVVPVCDAEGKVLRWFGTNTDVSELERTTAALRESEEQLQLSTSNLEKRVQERTAELTSANKELESFTYSVSHDLRAPLRGIDGWSLALLEDYGDKLNEESRGYLERVRTETQRMGQLIDDLLRLSRVTRAEMNRTRVDLSALANSITSRIREANPGRDTEFTIEPGLTVEGDPRLLDIALTNLLDNAAKFSSKRANAKVEFGEIDHTNRDKRGLQFYVRDNGAGFDMAYASQLFGAFQRLHSASEFPGTGIGLATVQRVILRHGGTICAESKPDEGATFYFTIGGAN